MLLAVQAMAWDPFKGPNSDNKDGKELVAKGDHAKALEAFDRAGVTHKNSPVVWFNRGIALAGQTRFEEAKDEFAKAANALPDAADRANATFNAGTTLVNLARVAKKKTAEGQETPVSAADRLKHIERAIYELSKALKARPDDGDAKWNLEVALRVEEMLKREKEREDDEKEKVEEGECLAGNLYVSPANGADEVKKALANAPEPAEKTPLAQALGFIAGLKTTASKAHRTAVVVVTDGMDTCGGDGSAAVEALGRAGVPTLVVGFAKGADPAKLTAMQEKGKIGWRAADRVYRAAEIEEIKAAIKELAPVEGEEKKKSNHGDTEARRSEEKKKGDKKEEAGAVADAGAEGSAAPETTGIPRDRLPVQVIVAVDRSQSMRHKEKWTDAKALVTALVDAKWSDGVSIGLMLFPWDDREKESGECGPAEVVVEPAEKTAAKIREVVAAQKPAEKTALGAALQQAAGIKAFKNRAERSVAVLVTDGVDTCGGKPEESIQELTKLGVRTAVVGFTGASDERMLAKLAALGGFNSKPLVAGEETPDLAGAVNVVVVLDRSESMQRHGRWEKAKATVEAVLAKYGDAARIGLVAFPWGKPEDKKDDKKDQKKDEKRDQKKDDKQDQKKDDQKTEPKQNPVDKNVPEQAKKQQDAAQKAERPMKLAPLRPPQNGRPTSKYTW
ncbi:MAG: VWA domain-containing protein [Deltaproteobacteria bacterium]|nr:VWA domain-containing protein [Deltaproteobacteria bacterium]